MNITHLLRKTFLTVFETETESSTSSNIHPDAMVIERGVKCDADTSS